jgi:hypothetical protein
MMAFKKGPIYDKIPQLVSGKEQDKPQLILEKT